MRQIVGGFIKNVSMKWTNTGQLAVWPVGKCTWEGMKLNVILEKREEGG